MAGELTLNKKKIRCVGTCLAAGSSRMSGCTVIPVMKCIEMHICCFFFFHFL